MIDQTNDNSQPEFSVPGDCAPPIAEPLADIVCHLATLLREMLEPIWPGWKVSSGYPAGDLASAGCCIPSALVLREVLHHAIPEIKWKAIGGRPTRVTRHGGYTDRHGVSHPHLWVEGRQGARRITADITADQFGDAPPVLVINGGSRRYHATYAPTTYWKLESHERGTVWLWTGAFGAVMTHAPQREAAE